MSIMRNNKVVATSETLKGYHPPILSCMWSDHIINDIQWLRADTFSWQSGDVYKTVYDKLVEEYSTGTEETEGSITFKRSTNGFKIATYEQESNVLNKYNTDSIAWYYILDTENRRFKLPRTKWGFKGLRDSVGSDISESLPNIKGTIGPVIANGGNGYFLGFINGTGAFNGMTAAGISRDGYVNSANSYDVNIPTFDASRSSSSYQDNAPVQERATQMYLYFYVGEFAQTSIEQTAGLNSEQLNNKVDVSSLREINPMIISYVNGTSGYNIWSNGYCEQWGKFSSGACGDSYVTISLLKPYANTNYVIFNCQEQSAYTSNWGSGCSSIHSSNRNTSYFELSVDGCTNTTAYFWHTKGYLAAGTY